MKDNTYKPMFYGNSYIVTMNEKMVMSELGNASKSKETVQRRCDSLNMKKSK